MRLSLTSTVQRFVNAHALTIALALAASPAALGQADAFNCSWNNLIGDPGITGNAVWCFEVFDDGRGPALYVGGDFSTAGGQAIGEVARWDGQNWSTLGSGTVGAVLALKSHDDGSGPALYAAGNFVSAGGLQAGRIARWNGSAWSTFGQSGTFGLLQALEVFDDGDGPALYVSGFAPSIDGVAVNHIAKWDGDEWSSLAGGMNTNVVALEVFDDGSGPALYATGGFTQAGLTAAGGPVVANNIAKWDGTSWSALGSGTNAAVVALAAGPGPALYVGGSFSQAGGSPANNIAKWDGKVWSPVGSGTFGTVTTLAFDVSPDGAGTLYAGGAINGPFGDTDVARFNGLAWEHLWSAQGGVGAVHFTQTPEGTLMHIGGGFTTFGGRPANNIVQLKAPYVVHDIVCDGFVDMSDLLAIISAWGPCVDCPPTQCNTDLNSDCMVNIQDLLLVVHNWEPDRDL